MQDPKNVDVYNEAYALALDLYKLKLPPDEKYCLEQQLKRATYSIFLNIAEGCGRQTDAEFVRFLFTSFGSIKEVESILDFGKDMGMIGISDYNAFKPRLETLGRRLNAFIQTINRSVQMKKKGGGKSQ